MEDLDKLFSNSSYCATIFICLKIEQMPLCSGIRFNPSIIDRTQQATISFNSDFSSTNFHRYFLQPLAENLFLNKE